jgi:hypothetical protein
VNEILKTNLLAAIILPVVVACGKEVPQASDEQILAMLGERNALLSDAPSTITKPVEECPRVLSGLDDAIYKDMPAEILGMFKTECRTKLAKILGDKSKNDAGFSIEDFETKELATRISRIAADAEIKSAEFQENTRKQAEIDKANANAKKITDAKRQLEHFILTLDQRFAQIGERCAEWDRERAAANQRNRTATSWQAKPDACESSFKIEVKEEVNEKLEKLATLKFQAEPLIPYFRRADAAFLADQIADISAGIKELKAVKPLD